MGYAYGQLFKKQLPIMINQFYKWASQYLQKNVSDIITRLPKFIKKPLAQDGVALVKKLLDLNYLITKKYTPDHWDQQFKGVAKSTGLHIHDIRRINLIPELLKASCSLGGWWGNATINGNLLQLRALDWQQHAPIAKFPCITIYHPTQKNSVPFANIAWIGFLGSLTGYSSAKIAVSERLKGGPNSAETRVGTPWTYVLRDTMQYSKNIQQALNYLNNANRTCIIYVGLGSGQQSTYRLLEYSQTSLNIYDDTNWRQDQNHPREQGMIWKAYKDTLPCFKNHFVPNYGKIDAQLIYRYVAPRAQTGDSQVIVMDHQNDVIYAAYPNPVTQAPGYQRPTIKIDLKDRFNEDFNENFIY